MNFRVITCLLLTHRVQDPALPAAVPLAVAVVLPEASHLQHGEEHLHARSVVVNKAQNETQQHACPSVYIHV